MMIVYGLQVDDLELALKTVLDIESSTGMVPDDIFCGFWSYEYNTRDAKQAIKSEQGLKKYIEKHRRPDE